MKAQSPDSRFRKTLNYSLAAFFLIVRPLNQTEQCRPYRESSEGGMGVYPLPAEPGRLSLDLFLVSIPILTPPIPCVYAAITSCPHYGALK